MPWLILQPVSLSFASLNSGSNGNCYYVGNDTEAVFIDAGLSCRETERRMDSLGLSMERLRAIFISHEHADHINGVARISKKYDLPVFVTPATQRRMRPYMQAHRAVSFEHNNAVHIGGLCILPFKKYHDGCDPHSFTVSGNGVTIGVFTDLGQACDNLVTAFRRCHVALLEANYDEAMLEHGRYPLHLKNRIRGGNGHLSNREALDVFLAHRAPYLTHLLLAHLSKENNDPALVTELFRRHAGGVEVAVASRYAPSPVYTIGAGGAHAVGSSNPFKSAVGAAFDARPFAAAAQMSLAFE